MSKSNNFLVSSFLPPSVIISICLVLQGGASLNLWCFPKSLKFLPRVELACDPTLYPFTEYPMFNATHQLGSKYTKYLLFAILEDSTEVPIIWSDFGFSQPTQWSFFNQVIRPLISKDSHKIAQLFQYYQHINGKKVKLFRLEKHSVTLIEEGFSIEPVNVIVFDAQNY